jgi:ubiquinone/menaquinone biosynthesis C-methylase UbiE
MTEQNKPIEEVFDEIYLKNYWTSNESRSGRGSELIHTADIREWLPELIFEKKIQSILDVGCGDFNWMRTVRLDKPYIGVDISASAIKVNKILYERKAEPSRTFLVANAVCDRLPSAELVIARDVLYHLTFEHIGHVLANIARSAEKWILITNNPATTENVDIIDGKYRRLNFGIRPFRFPTPATVFQDCPAAKEKMLLYSKDAFQKIVEERKYHVG